MNANYVTFFEIEQNGESGVHTCTRQNALDMIEYDNPRYACIIGVTDEGTPTVIETLVENDSYVDRRLAIECSQYLFGE